jgi:hypothetical protein
MPGYVQTIFKDIEEVLHVPMHTFTTDCFDAVPRAALEA